MGVLVALPNSPHYSYPRQQQHRRADDEKGKEYYPIPPLERADLKTFMRQHSQKGTRMGVKRTRFVGKIEEFPSPIKPEVIFGLKRCGNREDIQRQDMSETVRYIQRAGTEEFVTEKDYPIGTTRANTILLALVKWNIEDEDGKAVPINYDNLIDYTDPEELAFLYDKTMEINPLWAGTREERKNSSEPSSSPS